MITPSLFVAQFPTNKGYATTAGETLLYQAGMELAQGKQEHVHFAYRGFQRGHPASLPRDFSNLIELNFSEEQSCADMETMILRVTTYVKQHGIRFVLFNDIQPIHPMFRPLRHAGVSTILSYWGSTISSLMPAWKLFLKRLEIALSNSRVDGLIFQVQAMAQLAIDGRGVPERMVDVVPQGVDVNLYTPGSSDYVYRALSFPSSRRVIIYAGHMERRKGPHVLVDAAIELLARRERKDVCFLLCGNKEGESLEYERAYEGMGIDSFIKFGGYRSDLKEIYQSCFCGVVPSSGWDSFPRTSLELAASGLPVIVSRLGGLPESIVDGRTGLLFDSGNAKQLADRIEMLLDNPKLAKEYGEKGRERCVRDLNLANQLNRLMIAIRRHIH